MITKIIAIAGVLAASSSFAISTLNTTPFPGAGNIVLGVVASGGVGATKNVELNLGTATTVAAKLPGGVFANIGADLSAAYGSNWATRTDLTFGIVGYTTSGLSNSTAWFSKRETTPGTLSTPWARTTNSLQTAEGPVVKSMYNALAAAAAGSNANVATVDSSVILSGTWNQQIGSPNAFKSPYAVVNVMNEVGGISDIWQLLSGSAGQPGTLVNSVQILSNGDVVAVPETSTYAMILAGLTLCVVGARRFAKKA
jgi:hypothetical protein